MNVIETIGLALFNSSHWVYEPGLSFIYFECFKIVKFLSWTLHSNFSAMYTLSLKRKQYTEILKRAYGLLAHLILFN